jgi:hypothetical protein
MLTDMGNVKQTKKVLHALRFDFFPCISYVDWFPTLINLLGLLSQYTYVEMFPFLCWVACSLNTAARSHRHQAVGVWRHRARLVHPGQALRTCPAHHHSSMSLYNASRFFYLQPSSTMWERHNRDASARRTETHRSCISFIASHISISD